jgi:uncharacterized membrane protein
MTHTTAQALRLFVTGLLAALPLVATLAVFWWLLSLLNQWLGPSSAVGGVLKAVGLGVSGSEVVGYTMGLGVLVIALMLLGAGVELGLQRGLARVFDALLGRIPVVRTVYDLAQKLVGLLDQRDNEGVRAMSPVWVHFGGEGGAAALALLSSPEVLEVRGRRCLAVLVPTAPVPVGGGLLYVPEDWVTPAELGVEALTSIYVSMGVTSAQHLASPAAVEKQTATAAPP